MRGGRYLQVVQRAHAGQFLSLRRGSRSASTLLQLQHCRSYTTGYVSAAPAPIVEYVQPSLQTVAQAPIVAGPASVVEYVPQVPVYEYVQPTPFFQTAVLAPIFGYQFAPTQQLVYGAHQVPYCDRHKEAEGCLLLNVLPLVVRIHHAALSYVVWTSAILS